MEAMASDATNPTLQTRAINVSGSRVACVFAALRVSTPATIAFMEASLSRGPHQARSPFQEFFTGKENGFLTVSRLKQWNLALKGRLVSGSLTAARHDLHGRSAAPSPSQAGRAHERPAWTILLQARILGMSEKLKFHSKMIKDGRWSVAVNTGNGAISHVGNFATEEEANRWIATESKNWPNPVDKPK
jgi:hypothetical protein